MTAPNLFGIDLGYLDALIEQYRDDLAQYGWTGNVACWCPRCMAMSGRGRIVPTEHVRARLGELESAAFVKVTA